MVQFTSFFVLRTVLILTTFFFVAQQLPILSFFHWFPNNLFFYLALPLLSLILLFVTWRNTPHFLLFAKSILLSYLPVALIFLLGVSFSEEFHYLVPFCVGLYVISVLAYWIANFIIKEQKEQTPTKAIPIFAPFSWYDRDKRTATFFVVALTLIFFGFGIQNLTHFAAVDEPLWLDGRIGKFWKSITEQRMDKTLVSDKPGITVVLATGPGLFFVEPKEYRETRHDFTVKHPEANIEDLYLAFRLPLLIAITLLLPFFYLLLVPLVGSSAALFGYSAITLSPILIGMSKIVNPDSLLWVFAPLSFLAYLVFLEKRVWRFLILSGVFFGLALLTKYVANFLVVYFFAFSFLFPLWKRDETLSLRFLFKVFLVWFGIGLTVLYLFLPAFWIEPAMLLTTTIFSQAFEKVSWIFIVLMSLVFADQFFLKNRVSNFLMETLRKCECPFAIIIISFFVLTFAIAFVNGLFGMPWINFSAMLDSPKTSGLHHLLALFFTNFYPLAFGTAPLLLLGVSIMIWKTWWRSFRTSPILERLTLAIILFILLYYFGSTVNGVVLMNRYQIMLYPLFALLGGIGLFVLIEELLRRFQKPAFSLSHLPSLFFLIGTILILTLIPLLTPFPLSYSSSLLPHQFSVDHKDMGAGSYEAAQYLNQLPRAKETAIWTDKTGVCKFYVGPCIDGFSFKRFNDYRVQYLVLSSGRESRTLNRFNPQSNLLDDEHLVRIDAYYQREDALHTIYINGRPSQTVKIFSLNP